MGYDSIRALKEAPNRHRLYVRAQKFWPEDEKEWCVKNPVTNEWEYVFKILVEDATRRFARDGIARGR